MEKIMIGNETRERKNRVMALLLAMVLAFMCAGTTGCGMNSQKPLAEYWSADSEAAESLRNYVTKVTNKNDADNYIPVEDRIAVFDMDGTLTCETFYTYYDTMMFINYCLVDHPEKVSDELKAAAMEIKPG